MKTYILIDYENVQPTSLETLDRAPFQVMVFVGASQAKVTFEVASALQRMGERAAYIKVAGNGSNALDFHIAFYIGQLAAREPDAHFHVVSKDAGFDPLIAHLKSRKIQISRVKAVTDLPRSHPAPQAHSADRVSTVIDNLMHRGTSKPRTVKTLASVIQDLFRKKLSAAEVEEIMKELTKRGIVVVDQSRVTYAQPA